MMLAMVQAMELVGAAVVAAALAVLVVIVMPVMLVMMPLIFSGLAAAAFSWDFSILCAIPDFISGMSSVGVGTSYLFGQIFRLQNSYLPVCRLL
jgi:hypothetical protein